MAVTLNTRRAGGYTNRQKTRGGRLALPAFLWLIGFFILPLTIVLAVSFLTRGTRGAFYSFPLTLEHYQRILGPIYSPVFVDSIWIALQTMIICLVIGYPLAFYISTRKNPRVQQFALFLVILPFWTNFLVRTYAWRVILGNEGILNTLMLNLHLIQEPLTLLNTRGAVLVGLVYGFLPFMILPIYASIERFEFRLVEAGHDLGANDLKVFWRVVLPLTMPGVSAGCILVLIPAIGSFITPDLLGGTQGLMIGNLISGQFRGTGNWPLGSASSMIMMAMVIIVLIGYGVFNRRRA